MKIKNKSSETFASKYISKLDLMMDIYIFLDKSLLSVILSVQRMHTVIVSKLLRECKIGLHSMI